ncbi:hypothetical protein BIW11_12490 [Tropilaelaps mercedesae]|uniref:Uncharacterized protein n=1 Tax=Tropilaelaps mercedesae TaxID=418985 RepID=A0A1V9X6U3_9ACAR|nr:hypothetical protein BIW11_12490 [Tropilaelaps mercedesae]
MYTQINHLYLNVDSTHFL